MYMNLVYDVCLWCRMIMHVSLMHILGPFSCCQTDKEVDVFVCKKKKKNQQGLKLRKIPQYPACPPVPQTTSITKVPPIFPSSRVTTYLVSEVSLLSQVRAMWLLVCSVCTRFFRHGHTHLLHISGVCDPIISSCWVLCLRCFIGLLHWHFRPPQIPVWKCIMLVCVNTRKLVKLPDMNDKWMW